MEGPGSIDPGAIIPEVSICDLASVFDKKRHLNIKIEQALVTGIKKMSH